MDTNVYREISLLLRKDDALSLVIMLDQNAFHGLCGYYEVLFDETKSNLNSDFTTVVLFFQSDDSEAGIRIEIFLAALGIEAISQSEKQVSRTEYLEAYKKHYTSFDITERIKIVPSWEKEKIITGSESDKIYLYLDPGLAFGTGLHPTSKLCLGYMDENPPAGLRIIDAGCGSGILSIGAILLGAEEVFAFDIDGNSILAVRNNLELNSGVDKKIILKKGGFDLKEFTEYPADILLGNLTASILLTNRNYINQGKYNKMILSGILSEKEEEVIEAFQDKWKNVYRSGLDGWSILVFDRIPNTQ